MEKFELTPGALMEMSGYYWKTCTLHAGVKLDIFTILGSDNLSGQEIAEKLNIDSRGLIVLLNALTALGLLVKDQEFYANTPQSLALLSKNSRQYIGFIILHHHHLAESWVNMDQAVIKGGPIRQNSSTSSEELRTSFLMGMYNIAMAIAPSLSKKLDLAGCTSLLDLGGGPGTYAVHFCLANPKLTAAVFDLPTTRLFAEKIISQFKVSDRVSFIPGDYTKEDFFLARKFDAVWLSHIIHGQGPDQAEKIIKKAVSALRPGGKIFIHEFILDNNMASPLFPALFSLNMFLGTEQGKSYSEKQLVEILTAQKVKNIVRLDFKGPSESGIISGRID